MLKQDEHLWRVSKWERLCTGYDCLSSNSDLMDDSNSTSCCLCHRYVSKNVRKVCIAKLGQGLLGVVSTLLQFCGILAIRETGRVMFCQKQTIVRP